jgi:23S rRNA (cytosine1962-C5)-methyltransferase
MNTVYLKEGRSAPFIHHHPWLFSGAIASVAGNPQPADVVKVVDEKGVFIAYGLYNPHSQIRVRLYSFHREDILNDAFWVEKIRQAIYLRETILGFQPGPDSAYRLINSEGDGLSGLTVDRYGNYLSLQFTSLALYHYRDLIYDTLVDLTHPSGIILRTEADILAEEGLQLTDTIAWGEQPSNPVIISENGIRMEINLTTGQKTGFYLDQRANRAMVESFAGGKAVLDLCTYSGGFALHAACAGASGVTAVDVSASALELAKRNAELNGFTNLEFIRSDMFKFLDYCLAEGKKYGLIILDPPKLTHSKGSVQNALKGYLQLNASALKCLSPGGVLFTCSCSGRVSLEDFLLMLHRAALVADKTLRILEIRGADKDHPVLSTCQESEYLKCVVCYAE